ncbi:MAG: hypothetical protein NTZ73_04095 [Candidatus Diapherotrites archaeon]|nr:hypothetical protein [Candidatus Diapherotrites archaeon]
MRQRGQSSLEFLLLLLGFFSAFAIILPAISYSMEAFFDAGDSALAKQIAETVQEKASFFEFLGDGSKEVFEFVPARKITISSEGKIVFFASPSQTFEAILGEGQNLQRQEFTKKFVVEIEKSNGIVGLRAYSK